MKRGDPFCGFSKTDFFKVVPKFALKKRCKNQENYPSESGCLFSSTVEPLQKIFESNMSKSESMMVGVVVVALTSIVVVRVVALAIVIIVSGLVIVIPHCIQCCN